MWRLCSSLLPADTHATAHVSAGGRCTVGSTGLWRAPHPGACCLTLCCCRVVREEILVMGESRNNNFSVSCFACTQAKRHYLWRRA